MRVNHFSDLTKHSSVQGLTASYQVPLYPFDIKKNFHKRYDHTKAMWKIILKDLPPLQIIANLHSSLVPSHGALSPNLTSKT